MGTCHMGTCRMGTIHMGTYRTFTLHMGTIHMGTCHMGTCRMGTDRTVIFRSGDVSPRHTSTGRRRWVARMMPAVHSAAQWVRPTSLQQALSMSLQRA